MTISEEREEVKLQDLLDHTTKRLAPYVSDLIKNHAEKQLENLILTSKWGCAGSSGLRE